MTRTKSFLYVFLLLLFGTIALAKQPIISIMETSVIQKTIDSTPVNSTETQKVFIDSSTIKFDSVAPLPKKKALIYPPPFKDYRRLGYNSSIYLGATLISFGVLWVMPVSATNWDKEEMKEKGIFWKWNKNVKAGPVMDNDNWQLNYLAHPYCGGIYYMTARSSGFSALESFGYSVLMSTFFWEYGIESFAEIPSTQDLIITPILGSAVGEGFFYAKKTILRHDHKILKSKFLGYTALFFMDPFNTILDGFGFKEKIKTQINIAPVGFDANAGKTVWGVNFSASF
jgi:hypothetical protein